MTAWWDVSHRLLYPDTPYDRLIKGERFRITELAIRLAGQDRSAPLSAMDEEFNHILSDEMSKNSIP